MSDPTTITVRERIIRDGKLLHRIGEELHAGYARALGIRDDGTDGQRAAAREPREDTPDSGAPMDGTEVKLGEEGVITGGDGSGHALPPIDEEDATA
jgi:hypothetical protein